MNELRPPSTEESTDWNNAWTYADLGEKPDVMHLAACVFGENDGPDWVWIFQTSDLKWGWLIAGCDYTGWDCQSSGDWLGGYKTAKEAIENVPDKYKYHELIAQIEGKIPYGMSD